jgi:hypothetical protein
MEQSSKKRKTIKGCIVSECKKIARSGFDRCIKHGGGKRCVIDGCQAGAVGKYDKCIKHGGGKKCVIEGCKTCAIDGYDKCVKHGGGKRCVMSGCQASALNGFDKCFKHGGRKRCVIEGCSSGAKGRFDKCSKHGGGKKCNADGCETAASGGFDKCSKHGGVKKCVAFNCQKNAKHPSDKCVSHGGGKRCPNCIDWIDSRGAKEKFDGYCGTCFKRLFPEDPRSKVIYEHTKEIRVRNFINEHFDGFVHDKPLYTGSCDCTHRRRIDHRKLINETVLAIETDEFGHRDYDEHDEEVRYDDLYMIHSGKWIFVRFNPDDNYDKTNIEDKLEVLLETMKEQIDRIEQGENTEPLEIIKLFCQ